MVHWLNPNKMDDYLKYSKVLCASENKKEDEREKDFE